MADKENEWNGAGKELVGISEATYGAEEQGRPCQVQGHRVVQHESQYHDQRALGSEDADAVADHREKGAAGHRAKGQRQDRQEAAEVAANSANLERRTEKSAQDLTS